MDEQGTARNIGDYLAIGATFVLIAYCFVNGIMYLVKPRQWARSGWLPIPDRFLPDLNRPSYLFQLRIVGLVLVLLCLAAALALLGVDTRNLAAIAMAIVLLILMLCGPVLMIAGLYFVILPRRWDGPPWHPLGLALRNRIRNSVVLQILVRAFGLVCFWASWRLMTALLSQILPE